MVRTLTDAAAVPEEKAVSNTAVAEARWWSFMAAGVICVEVLFVFAKTKNYEIKLSYKLHEGWNEATCRPKCASRRSRRILY